MSPPTRASRRSRARGALIVFIAAVGVVGAGCGHHATEDASIAPGAAGAPGVGGSSGGGAVLGGGASGSAGLDGSGGLGGSGGDSGASQVAGSAGYPPLSAADVARSLDASSDLTECTACIAQLTGAPDGVASPLSCGDVLESCELDATCASTVGCVLADRLVSGRPAGCSVVACASSDTTTASSDLYSCVAMQCGAACGGFAILDPHDADCSPPGGAGGAPDGVTITQAMNALFLGDTGWDGTVSPNLDDWQTFGFNVDGAHFTATNQASFHCKLQPGGDASDEVIDGMGGIDNSFGKNVLPILESFDAMPSAGATASILAGETGLVVRLDGISPSPDTLALTVEAFDVRGSDADGAYSPMPVPPTSQEWTDGLYVWHPIPTALVDPSVVDPAAYQAIARFPMSYVSQNVGVGVGNDPLSLTLSFPANAFPLSLHRSQLQLTLAPNHDAGSMGMLGGVLVASEVAATLKSIAISVSTSFCTGGTLDSIIAEIWSTADMGADGTQDPTKLCDGISIGLGFTTSGGSLGAPTPPIPVTYPCTGN